jgi:hypothetical protein
MKHSDRILEALDARRARFGAANVSNPHVATVAQGDNVVTVKVVGLDEFGALVEEITVAGPPSARAVDRRASALCDRLEYLPERPRLMEAEPAQGRAIARTQPVVGHGGYGGYTEIGFEGDHVQLERYEARVGELRRRATLNLGREHFSRLIDDLADAV